MVEREPPSWHSGRDAITARPRDRDRDRGDRCVNRCAGLDRSTPRKGEATRTPNGVRCGLGIDTGRSLRRARCRRLSRGSEAARHPLRAGRRGGGRRGNSDSTDGACSTGSAITRSFPRRIGRPRHSRCLRLPTPCSHCTTSARSSSITASTTRTSSRLGARPAKDGRPTRKGRVIPARSRSTFASSRSDRARRRTSSSRAIGHPARDAPPCGEKSASRFSHHRCGTRAPRDLLQSGGRTALHLDARAELQQGAREPFPPRDHARREVAAHALAK